MFRHREFQKCKEFGWFTIHWSVYEDTNTLKVGVVGKVDGWLGFGLSSSGSMKGADIMVGRFNDEDVFVLEDRYSDNFVTPSLDDEQNVELLEGGASRGYTWWVGTRKIKRDCSSMDRLNDLDAYQYDAIQNIIVAAGASHAFERHTIRTATGLPLLEDVEVIPEPVEATQTITLQPEDENGAPFVVPANRTTYWCTPFIFPNDTKYHTVKVVPRVADHGLMHHMIMYLCNGEPRGASECSRPNGGVDEICSGSYYTWTPGRTTMYTPLEAGMPFGKGSTTYFMLQMHYDNPEGRTGVVDTTAFDFIYTSELRQHDLGLMWLGALLSDINIPPGQPAHLVDNVCSSECTQLRIPEGGVTFVDIRDHMHRFGRSAGTEVMRDGKVIQDLTWNRYDYNHQGGAQVTFKLLPGDSMRHWCTYDTLNTDEAVQGGRTAADEMCFGFLMHYPATLGMCIAYPGETATICQKAGGMPSLVPYSRSSAANNFTNAERVNERCGETPPRGHGERFPAITEIDEPEEAPRFRRGRGKWDRKSSHGKHEKRGKRGKKSKRCKEGHDHIQSPPSSEGNH